MDSQGRIMIGPFTEIWRRRLIEQDLAGFVVAALERGDSSTPITAAMNEIDQLLAANPEGQGESRDPFERILIVPPLAVEYEIHDEERIVYVLRARYLARHAAEE
jgi:hypothetical protein